MKEAEIRDGSKEASRDIDRNILLPGAIHSRRHPFPDSLYSSKILQLKLLVVGRVLFPVNLGDV